MHRIYYDPTTWEWLPALEDYTVTPYNLSSFLVEKIRSQEAYVVDLLDYNGKGSCTCADFAMRKDPQNNIPPHIRAERLKTGLHQSCKHLRLVRYILRKYSQDQKQIPKHSTHPHDSKPHPNPNSFTQ
jgi:hypothetical protein